MLALAIEEVPDTDGAVHRPGAGLVAGRIQYDAIDWGGVNVRYKSNRKNKLTQTFLGVPD